MEGLIAKARQDTHFMESVRAIQTIKLFQRETDRQLQWQRLLANSINCSITAGAWQAAFETVDLLVFGIENILIVYVGSRIVIEGQVTVGMLFAFIAYKSRFLESTKGLIFRWFEYRTASMHLERLSDIVFSRQEQRPDVLSGADDDTKAASNSGDNGDQIPKGAISVEGLAYRYSATDAFAFKNVSFTIGAGETVAITGPSGCGKTTLLKCLMGILEPTSGEIQIDNRPIQKMGNYRSRIAGILQDDHFLSGTVAENIACFAADVDMEFVVECARAAAVHSEISRMPMGYDTLLGDLGSGLSGGQLQRLYIARALYRRPMILFMDEATSHLDAENERIINDHIRALKITRVIVAHRTETLRSASRVIQMTPSL